MMLENFCPFHLVSFEPAAKDGEALLFAGWPVEVAPVGRQGASPLLVSAWKDELL